MTSPTTETKLQRHDRKGTTALAQVSLMRLYLLRLGYFVMAAGLVVTK